MASSSNGVPDTQTQTRTPLKHDEIRLVKIECDNVTGSSYALTTSIFPIGACPPYTALSYACGTKKTTIVVDGVGGHKIHENFLLALPCLVAFGEHQQAMGLDRFWLWVDSVSIDQQNDEEKARQILQMTEIYRGAEQVLVWLGQGILNLANLMQCFALKIGPQAREAGVLELDSENVRRWPHFSDNLRLNRIKSRLERLFRSDDFRSSFATDLEMIRAFEAMTHLPWFARTWTIQEHTIATKTTFALGGERVPGNDFTAAFICCNLWVVSLARPLMQPQWLILRLTRVLVFWWFNQPLWTVLLDKTRKGWNPRASIMLGERRKLSRSTQNQGPSETSFKSCIIRTFCQESSEPAGCKEPKDRIWALLGMCTDRSALMRCECGSVLHYTLPWEETYRNIARSLLGQGHTDILAIRKLSIGPTSSFANHRVELPSWTTNWAIPLRRPLCGFTEDNLFNAATHLRVHVTTAGDCHDSRTISINGYFIDHIQALGSLCQTLLNDLLDYGKAHTYLQEIENFVLESAVIPESEKPKAAARIPIHDLEYTYFAQMQRATDAGSARGFKQMREYANQKRAPQTLIGQDLLSYQTFMERCSQKRPFITTRGFVGLSHGEAETSDMIAALAGMSGLVVLRPMDVEAGNPEMQRFSVVGEAYGYGLMDGEVENLPAPVQERRFLLC